MSARTSVETRNRDGVRERLLGHGSPPLVIHRITFRPWQRTSSDKRMRMAAALYDEGRIRLPGQRSRRLVALPVVPQVPAHRGRQRHGEQRLAEPPRWIAERSDEVVKGKSGSVRVDRGGGRSIKKK